jgi:hypothetical protein
LFVWPAAPRTTTRPRLPVAPSPRWRRRFESRAAAAAAAGVAAAAAGGQLHCRPRARAADEGGGGRSRLAGSTSSSSSSTRQPVSLSRCRPSAAARAWPAAGCAGTRRGPRLRAARRAGVEWRAQSVVRRTPDGSGGRATRARRSVAGRRRLGAEWREAERAAGAQRQGSVGALGAG